MHMPENRPAHKEERKSSLCWDTKTSKDPHLPTTLGGGGGFVGWCGGGGGGGRDLTGKGFFGSTKAGVIGHYATGFGERWRRRWLLNTLARCQYRGTMPRSNRLTACSVFPLMEVVIVRIVVVASHRDCKWNSSLQHLGASGSLSCWRRWPRQRQSEEDREVLILLHRSPPLPQPEVLKTFPIELRPPGLFSIPTQP